MPDLSGRGYEDAVQIIRMLGLQVGSTIYEKSEVLLPRSVVSQSVRPGKRIRRGDMVNLVLSHL
jgi:beta-lactam-binding protein with PASTA domain